MRFLDAGFSGFVQAGIRTTQETSNTRCAIRVGQASKAEEIRQGHLEEPTQVINVFVQSRSPASLVTGDMSLKSLAANSLAARDLAELAGTKIRSTFFLPKQIATDLPGSWSHKR
jgi:hypothetical protein